MAVPSRQMLWDHHGLRKAQDDGALVEASREGDDEAFDRLFTRYRAQIYGTCYRYLQDAAAAEDVVQDTFLRAYLNLAHFDTTRRLLPWLTAIAIRRCIDLQRRRAKISLADHMEERFPDLPSSDEPLDVVVASEDRRELDRALATLPERQRRAVLLYALEGWSYSDIAAAEGVSVTSTKSLLFRARSNLRRVCRGETFGAMVPLLALRQRMRRGAEAIKTRGELLMGSACSALQPVGAGTLAILIAMTVSSGPGGIAPASPLSPADHADVMMGPSTVLATAPLSRAARPFSADETTDRVANEFLAPSEGATPEKTQFTSFAVSPDYENDRTVFAAGRVDCGRVSCPVLFRSSDGGVSWDLMQADGFTGEKIMLSPRYASDGRIFAMGPGGLQESKDGGATFRHASIIEGDLAISPAIDAKGPLLLIGNAAILEYRADSGTTGPAATASVGVSRQSVMFSERFKTDRHIYVGTLDPDESGSMRSSIKRCTSLLCETFTLSSLGVPSLRPSMHGGAIAFTHRDVYELLPGATPTSLGAIVDGRSNIRDVEILGNEYLVSVQGLDKSGYLMRFNTETTKWTSAAIEFGRFRQGPAVLEVLPDGRVLAASSEIGLACSADGARTWSACGLTGPQR